MSAERKKLLEVENLTVRFGSRRHPFTAVNGVSFHIFEGESHNSPEAVICQKQPGLLQCGPELFLRDSRAVSGRPQRLQHQVIVVSRYSQLHAKAVVDASVGSIIDGDAVGFFEGKGTQHPFLRRHRLFGFAYFCHNKSSRYVVRRHFASTGKIFLFLIYYKRLGGRLSIWIFYICRLYLL